ncbi:MAG: hypothetical protein RMK90_12605 [Acetobacteraceae bacterium]|nr:hypothetical protein [Acetobacteraceae bacterium]
MSARARLETAIVARVAAAAPRLAGDVWARLRMSVAFTRLEVSASGAVGGEAEALLWGEGLDALPAETLITALRAPILDETGAPALRARLVGYREELLETAALGRLSFAVDLLYP